jgi:RNA polymerase sigma-70 factor, ECF subfamily
MHSATEEILQPTTTAQADDPGWLAAARHGDPKALEWLFRTYHRPVYGLCCRLLGRAADAEDSAQTTFVRAFRALPGFGRRSSLKTWLYKIAVNECLNVLRQRRRAACQLSEDWPVADAMPSIVQKTAIADVLRRMRPEQRLVLVLFYWEDLSCEEIAAVTDISLSAAKMRLKRAREEFQRQYGGEP